MSTLRRLRGGSSGTIKKQGEVSDSEMEKIKTKIVAQWKTMQGVPEGGTAKQSGGAVWGLPPFICLARARVCVCYCVCVCVFVLPGMTNDEAREGYMAIIQNWEGYGCNLFEVVQTSRKDWPKDVWLGISLEGVSIFPVNQCVRAPLPAAHGGCRCFAPR
jgi:myosin X